MYAQNQNFDQYTIRRHELVKRVKDAYSQTPGIILLIAGFENEKYRFLQESSFYYLTGFQEPGIVAAVEVDRKPSNATLFVPQFGIDRGVWMAPSVELTHENKELLGFDHVTALGKKLQGYQIQPFFDPAEYENVIALLSKTIQEGGSVFTLVPNTSDEYIEQRLVLQRLATLVPGLAERLVDISPLVATMRRVKSAEELEYLHRALEITGLAQEAAAKAIADGVSEAEVQAGLEYMIIGSSARISFPSIVASGINSTILHYHNNDRTMQDGEVIVVDIGAQVEGYCADITRTYPVSGKFTKRQREIYDLVLATQEYIASQAKPGMWLSNSEYPEKSLNHLAKKYLSDRGYGNYFKHGIGHFLGLDVHDVGDLTLPLQEGDVITIEPGIYIREENIGVRIEDNYWIVAGGAVCLSEDIPKRAHEVEALVKEVFMR